MKIFSFVRYNFGFCILFFFFYMYAVGNVFGLEKAYYFPFWLATIFSLFKLLKQPSLLNSFRGWFGWQLFLIGFMGFSIIWSVNQRAFFLWTNMFMIVLKVIVVSVICSSCDGGYNKLFRTFSFVGFVTFITLQSTGNLYAFRLVEMNFMENVNSFGLICDFFALGSFFSVVLTKKVSIKLFHFICLLFAVYMMLMTGGRKFIMFIFFLIVLFFFFRNSNIKITKILVLAIFSLFTLLGMFYAVMNVPQLYEAIGYRFDGGLEGQDDQSRLMDLAFELFLEHPFFGLGVAGFQVSNPSGMYSHCNYTELLANFGIIGFSIYYLLHIKCFLILIKNRSLQEIYVPIFLSLLFSIILLDTFSISFNQTAFVPLILMLTSQYCYNLKHSHKNIVAL